MTTTTTFSQWTNQYISGEWRKGHSRGEKRNQNPFDSSELVTIQLASVEDIDLAYQSAATAQKEWQKTSPEERSAILKKAAENLENRRDEIVQILITETGSSFAKANTEVDFSITDIG